MAGSSAIRAGRAFVELFAEPNKLYRALDAAKKRVLEWAKFTAKIGVGVGALGTSVYAPIVKFFKDAIEEGNDVENLANKFHTTAESISALKGAFAQAGVGGEQFGTILDHVSGKIAETASSRDEFIQGLIGLRGDQLLGKDVTTQLDMIANQFARIVNPVDQINQAMALGIPTSGALFEAFKKGAAGLRELEGAAKENGLVMSAQDAKDAKTIFVEFNSTMIAVKSTLLAVGKALLPTGKDFAEVGKDIREALADARAWIGANKQVIVVVTAVAAGLVLAGAALVGLSAAAAVLVPLITAGVLVAKGIAVAIGLILSPAGLVVVAVAAIAAGLIYLFSQTAKGQETFDGMREMFGKFAEWIKSSWQGVSDALKAGDWALAWQISLKTAEVAWRFFVATLTYVWVGLKDSIVSTFRDAMTGLKVVFTEITGALEGAFKGALRAVADAWNKIIVGDATGRLAKMFKIDLRGIETEAEIEERTKAEVRRIGEARKLEQERERAFRDGQKGAAVGLLAKAQQELDDLNAKAAEAAGLGNNALLKGGIAALLAGAPKFETRLPSFTQLFASAKGIFGGPAQQQLGYGESIGQRQLDATNNIVGAVAQSNVLLDEINKKPAAVWG